MSATSKYKSTPTFSFKGRTQCTLPLTQPSLAATIPPSSPRLISTTLRNPPKSNLPRSSSHNPRGANGIKLNIASMGLAQVLTSHARISQYNRSDLGWPQTHYNKQKIQRYGDKNPQSRPVREQPFTFAEELPILHHAEKDHLFQGPNNPKKYLQTITRPERAAHFKVSLNPRVLNPL